MTKREYRIEFLVLPANKLYKPISISAVIPEELAKKLMATPMNPGGHIQMSIYTNRGMLEDKTPLLEYKPL